MRLSISKSKNSTSLYVIESTYKNGIRSSRVVEKLGTVSELKKKLGEQDTIEWAKEYIAELNREPCFSIKNKKTPQNPYGLGLFLCQY